MKQRILSLLKKHSLPRKVILEFFSDEKEVNKVLDELISEGEIVYHNHKFYLPSQLDLIKGKIVAIKDTYSFASIEGEEDGYINNYNLNGAFIDDIVYLKRDYSYGYISYEVVSIIKRGRDKIIGEVREINGKFFLITKDVSSKDVDFIIEHSEVSLFDGYIVSAVITKETSHIVYLNVISIIGHKNDPGVDIERIILNHGADIEFPLEVREELKSIPDKLQENDYLNREDFTSRLIVTIDGEDAKDFDDAVEVERTSNGYLVGVHIADVSHYVVEDSPLDKEALSRGTSIYVTDRVVPMLPVELSNGICSLNPHVDRLVTSCIFEVDNFGNVINSRITKGVINSKARLTYTYVNKLFHHELNKDEHVDEEVDQMLFILNEVARKIRKRRNRLGAINLESTELKFICDESGKPLDVIKRKQDEAEELIEDLMICANEIVASTIENMKLPFAYRIHEQPKSKKIDSFIKLSNHLGYSCLFSSLTVSPKELSEHLEKINDKDKKEVLSMMLLRSLAKARYCIDNKGHFGLASSSYCHFTSPIRRYPDLLVHRLIQRYLIDGDISFDNTFIEEVSFICENSSIKERRALSIEREVEDLESAKYMEDKLGNIYSGIINGMSANGMFVELTNGINGFVDFDSLNDDYYIFDEIYMTARGRRTNAKYCLGDHVKVMVSRVDVDSYQITFTLINDKKTIKMKSENRITKRKERKHGRR